MTSERHRPAGAILYLLDDAAATGAAMAALARQADRARILAAVDDLNRTWPGFETDIHRKAAHALRRKQRAAKARLIRRRPQAAGGGLPGYSAYQPHIPQRATPHHGGRP